MNLRVGINFALAAFDAWFGYWLKKHQHQGIVGSCAVKVHRACCGSCHWF